METGQLKSFATWARTALIREVSARISVVLASKELRQEQPNAVAALENAVNAAGGSDKGCDTIADKVAYTWFNRIIALRFMDARAYTGIGVVSPEQGREGGQPEVLAEAKRGNIDSAVVTNQRTADTVTSLLNGTRRSDDPQGEAYALLLAEYCRHWNRSMPFMFEKEGDYTELLIPANLLADDSVMARAVGVLTEEVCQDVEVIGWLYQFYISERKDEVFAGFKKNRKAGAAEIPAATQLFTPHWIVRYLVENSLGRLWLLNHPTSRLVDQMDYYIAPADEETDFLKITKPEELKIIDPACGSGHMLTYAFDLLYAIYEEEGYAPSEIPDLILTHNLYGIEIDPRAGALAAFALTMKARAKRRTFFNEPVEPRVCAMENVVFAPAELDYLWSVVGGDTVVRAAADQFWSAFEHADTFGSLIAPDSSLVPMLKERMGQVEARDLFAETTLDKARRVLAQAGYLAPGYHVVVANPPYMGSGNMGGLLSDFVKNAFPKDKQDLYACFVSRAYELTQRESLIGMVVGDTWMTLSTFESFRTRLINEGGLVSCLHLDDVSNHPDIFGANTAFVLERGATVDMHCAFIHLEPMGSERKREQLLTAIGDHQSPSIYRVASSAFLQVPGKAFAYRMGEAVREVFTRFPQLSTVADARQGLSPGDTARFVRYWFEVSRDKSAFGPLDVDSASLNGSKWFPLNKGGAFRRWYGNIDHVINWYQGGKELLRFRPRSVIRNPQHYFRAAVTWSSVSSGESAFRSVDQGVIFSDVGQSIFADAGTRKKLLAILNSRFGSDLLALLAPNLHFQAGIIARMPVSADLDPGHANIVDELVELARVDWNTQETASGFEHPDWLDSEGSLGKVVVRRRDHWTDVTSRMLDLESRLDEMVQRAYGLMSYEAGTRLRSRVSLLNNPQFGVDEAQEARAAREFERRYTADLVSYAVGCMFGRYSLDEPGLVLADQGATLKDFLAKVPTPKFTPDKDNVIPVVDGDWFEDDIVARFRQFLRVAFGEANFEENLRFVTDALGVKELRDYFVKSFYRDHVQRYKKRPIYWLFSSPKGSFNALIYMHRYTPSTASTVLNEYLREFKAKLDASRQHHERLAAGTGAPRQQAAAQKEVDRLRKVLLELDEYEHDVLYPLASQQVQIDLDDGVKANYPKLGAALKKIPGLEANDE